MTYSQELGRHLVSILLEMVAEEEPKRQGGEHGTYNIYASDGKYVSWNRNFKDAKHHAAMIGGKAVKNVDKTLKKPESNSEIKMPDGSFAPFTRANYNIIKAHQRT